MKKLLSLILTAVFISSVLASCADTTAESSTASSVCADKVWLEERIGEIPDTVTVGLADVLGVDMSDFEDDGYFIRTSGGETVVCGKTADGLDRAVRTYAKSYEAGKGITDVTYHEGYRIERFTIAGRDISEYTVTYEGGSEPSTPSSSGTTKDNACAAAREFARLVKIACGADLPVVPADSSVSPAIRIGYLTDGSLGENGFTYEVRNGDLIINGAPDANGCGAAVCYLLEEECGWEGLIYGDAVLVEADLVDIPEGRSASVNPTFDYLRVTGNYYDKFTNERSAMSYGGKIANGSHGIQSNKWGGWKVGDGEQPCFSDEGYIENVCADVGIYIEAKPGCEWVDVGQGDNYQFCRCKNCQKIMKEENGTLSGPVVRFANAIDSYICENYPERDIKVLILAYAGTNVPCITPPNENVFVTFCTHGICANHYLDGTEECDELFDFVGVLGNRSFANCDYAEWLKGWCSLSENIYVWHYGLDNPFHQLTQNHNLYEDFRFIAECGVRGFIYEGETYGMGEGRLRLQELLMLQYHPEWTREEYDRAVGDLYEREFGDGGEYILQYTKNYWSRWQLAAGCHDCWGYTDLIRPESTDYATFCEYEDEANEILNKAIALADSEKQQKAAERFSCDFLYKECYLNYYRALEAWDTKTVEKLNFVYELFLERMAHNGFTKTYKNFAKKWTLHATLAEEAEANWTPWHDELVDPYSLVPISDEYEDGKRVYTVTRADSIDSVDWLNVPAAAIDIYKWVESTEYRSFAQLVYVEKYGFVCRMTCFEANPVAKYTKIDDTVCFDSCMEFFVNFGGNKYLNLEGNAIATVCMGSGSKRENRTTVNRKLPGGFKTVAEKSYGKWQLTYYLPIEEIQIFCPDISAETFCTGYTFSGNFYKTAGSQTGNEQYGMWNEVMTENPDFHRPEYFGTFIMG